MSNSREHVPPQILAQLANLKLYTVVLLYKGENYQSAPTQQIIQGEHLPYLFSLREQGIVLLSIPIMDNSQVAAVAVYNTPDKEVVRAHVENDPALIKNIFTYELLSGMGMKGDTLL